METGKVVLGTLVGFAAGALVGVLFAPKKGSETRKQIKEKSDEYLEIMESKLDDLVNSFSEKFERVKEGAENLVETGKDKLDDAKSEVKNASSNFKHEIGSKIDQAIS